MISSAEIKRLAGILQVATNVVEHDYVLGCFLRFLSLEKSVNEKWIFKGGTALEKCYFKDYRFSEDLDFSITKRVKQEELVSVLESVKDKMEKEVGILTSRQPVNPETIEDEYGKESIEAKVYYNGPMQPRGSARSIRIHLNHEEHIAFPPNDRLIYHAYSDAGTLPDNAIRVYSLEEMFAEKLRAISGQRRFAISRDLYDIFNLTSSGIDELSALKALKKKAEAKGLLLSRETLERLESRKDEYSSDWKNNLEYLVPEGKHIDFETAWAAAREYLKRGIEASEGDSITQL